MGILSKWLHKIRSNKIKPYLHGDVLDIGCGSASNYKSSISKINSYYGVEFDSDVVKNLSKEYPKAIFIQKDIDEDSLNLNKKFDCILLIAVIEHVFNQKHLMKEIINHLKPNGKIIITTPTVFGNDIVHRFGAIIGLFSKYASDDHIVVYNKHRFNILAKEFDLNIEKYSKFELGCNQLVILNNK